MAQLIPINVISGFLGVGKTTAINHLLRTKPTGERWAVLVNEFGEIGIDGALLNEERRDGIEIKELAGGCICCSAGVMFQVSLAVLLQSYRPDRLLIEPTGLATLSGVLDTLREPGFADAVDVRTFVTLVDPMHWGDPRYREHDVFRDQVDGADVLLASRGDLATAEARTRFEREAGALFPPKRYVGTVSHGALDPSLLDRVSQRTLTQKHTHHTAHDPADAPPRDRAIHRGEHAVTIGFVFPPNTLFLSQKLDPWLEVQATRPDLLRLKGVFRTERGWHAHNVTPTSKERRPSAYRRDSRVEVILSPDAELDAEAFEAELRGCIAGGFTKSS